MEFNAIVCKNTNKLSTKARKTYNTRMYGEENNDFPSTGYIVQSIYTFHLASGEKKRSRVVSNNCAQIYRLQTVYSAPEERKKRPIK